MKQKRRTVIFTAFATLLMLLSCLTAAAADTAERYKRVTSADEITGNVKYLIVGCSGGYEQDSAEYYTMADYEYNSINYQSGWREVLALVSNDDGTLNFKSSADTPLTLSFIPRDTNLYWFVTQSNTYLNGAYVEGSRTFAYNSPFSKSLPLVTFASNHISKWQPIFRSDGTVLFKTSRNVGTSSESSGYIRFHHQANNGGSAVFSGGDLGDLFIDLPDDESLTYSSLTEENIPVKTYLYKEICTHSEEYLTHNPAKQSTCAEQGNIEYYYCSKCLTYLGADKTTEIQLSDTKLPLAPHTNTTYFPAKEPTCTVKGNIAYTYCADCGGYFEGNATDSPIGANDTVIMTVNHSYVDGICRFCGLHSKTAYFDLYGTTGDGYRYIFAAEYNGKLYAMGEQTKKGMTAVEITQTAQGKLVASSETVAFTEEVSYGEMIKLVGTNTYYTPKYIKIGENYLTNDSLTLTLCASKESATYWRSDYGYDDSGRYINFFCDNVNGNALICLVTDEAEPYFSLCTSTDEAHIKAFRCGELCSHKDALTHTPEVAPTCTRDGNREYWYCNICSSYFSDKDGLEVINDYEIPLLSNGAKDSDNDGICDYCSKPMPIYTKVTSLDQIVMGNKYILVSEVDGELYALKMPEADKSGYYSDLGIAMTAQKVTPESDGTLKYNSAYNAQAIMINLGFACKCSELDEGTIRYALRTTAGNMALNLESYGGFCLAEYAKYGWRIALNEDGSAKMSDVYEESLEDWNSGSGKLCVYKLTENQSTSVFFSASESSAHTKEGEITKYPIYLYRLTETGTVNDITYTLNDAKSTVSVAENTAVPEESYSYNAASISNVEGVSVALTQTAIESLVTSLSSESCQEVHMDVDVNITATDYTAADAQTEVGASITFTVIPTVSVTTVSEEVGIVYNISNDALDGSPMTVTLYTGGIEPQQIIHTKHDGTREYFYPDWSEQVTQYGEKAFSQSYDVNGNHLYVTFTITEFSEIKLLETPESSKTAEFSVSDYNEKERTVNVSVAESGNYTLIFADFEKGALTGISILEQTFKQGSVTVDIPKDVALSSQDKIFLWESMENIRPLCEAYTIK